MAKQAALFTSGGKFEFIGVAWDALGTKVAKCAHCGCKVPKYPALVTDSEGVEHVVGTDCIMQNKAVFINQFVEELLTSGMLVFHESFSDFAKREKCKTWLIDRLAIRIDKMKTEVKQELINHEMGAHG